MESCHAPPLLWAAIFVYGVCSWVDDTVEHSGSLARYRSHQTFHQSLVEVVLLPCPCLRFWILAKIWGHLRVKLNAFTQSAWQQLVFSSWWVCFMHFDEHCWKHPFFWRNFRIVAIMLFYVLSFFGGDWTMPKCRGSAPKFMLNFKVCLDVLHQF